MDEFEKFTIEHVYQIYSNWMNCPEFRLDDRILSVLAYSIDAYALATLLNFIDKNDEMVRKLEGTNLLLIRMYALVTAELIDYLTYINQFDISQYEEPNNYKDILLLRNKIHQFRYSDFNKKTKYIDSKMERSRNVLEPHLDICLKYQLHSDKNVLMGTNVYQYNFHEAKERSTVELMTNIIRVVEQQAFSQPAHFQLLRTETQSHYKWETYSYADIVKETKFENERVLDRVLLAFDDLYTVIEFFDCTLLIDEYLIQAPYMLFYFVKMVSIVLDETFDNFKSYINKINDNNDSIVLQFILKDIADEQMKFCRILRNNLHYITQERAPLGDAKNLYKLLLEEMQTVRELHAKIQKVLNVKPGKYNIGFQRLLYEIKSLKE